MKAFVVARYGKDEVRAADVPEPKVGNRDVLVKVSAASINPLDSMVRNGEFKQLLKYKPPFVLGHDVAGVVTEVGADVRGFAVGDEVFARPRDLRIGTFAEYIAIDEDDVALKPATLSLHEAAAVPLVALAAWQILVEKAHVKPGQKVLVHAGAGGLGSTVIQLAKHLGAHVATTANGAKENWSATSEPTSSSTTPSRISPRSSRATTSWWTPWAGRTCEVAHRAQARRLGDRRHRPARRRIRQTTRRTQTVRVRAVVPEPQGPQSRQETRRALRVLLHARQWRPAARACRALRRGPLRPVIDTTFGFDQTLEALAFVESGKAKAGKVIVTLD